jgi:hypothetical protein
MKSKGLRFWICQSKFEIFRLFKQIKGRARSDTYETAVSAWTGRIINLCDPAEDGQHD